MRARAGRGQGAAATPERSLTAVAAGALALLAAAATTGCLWGRRAVVFDLARLLPGADRSSSREALLLGAVDSQRHLADGMRREVGGADCAWASRVAELSFSWSEVFERRCVLEMAPSPGNRGQTVTMYLNGERLASFGLNDERHRYAFPLPARAQRTGENRLRCEFSRAVSPAAGDGRQLAAYLYGLVVSRADDQLLDDLLQRGAPSVFSVDEQAAEPAIVQMGPSSVRYAFQLPASAELRFTPQLHPMAQASAGRASLRVTLARGSGLERELWRGEVTWASKSSREVALKLPGSPGELVQLALHVEGQPGERYAWAVWRGPRVLGSGVGTSFERPLYTVKEQQRADPLRRQLSGVNVILLVLDAARAAELGCYGYARSTTPEIDRIAAEGVLFEQAYTPAVYTLGAMASVWTSQPTDRHYGGLSFIDPLPGNRLTLAELLSAQGIYSAGFVANAMAGRVKGFARGFSEFHEIFGDPQIGSRAELFRRSLHPWLRRHDGTRFFAYAHIREPHFPYDPPAPFNTRFGPDAPLTYLQRTDSTWYRDFNQGRVRASPEELAHLVRLYDGNLAYADAEIGELRRLLESNGLWQRTAVIIMADHGEQLGERGYISHGAQMYEQSAHVPLIIHLPPGRGPRGLRVKGLVDLLDVAPTIADLFGVLGLGGSDREFQGRSLLPMVTGAKAKPATLARSLWDRPAYALRHEQFKYIYDSRAGAEQLFDLSADPAESQDLIAREPLRAAFYRQALQGWVGWLTSGADDQRPLPQPLLAGLYRRLQGMRQAALTVGARPASPLQGARGAEVLSGILRPAAATEPRRA